MQRSHFRGHPIIYEDENKRWVYEDNREPLPGWGGEVRPCIVCGSLEWSGDGDPDACLGNLPGVDNACCGHGVPEDAYIRFTNGVVIEGFDTIKYTEKHIKGL